MAEEERSFAYVAIDATGRRRTGTLSARSDAGAFERLKQDGLTPVRLRPAEAGDRPAKTTALTEREATELLADLGALLRAGSDMRVALGIIGARAGGKGLRSACRGLAAEIAGGGALDQAFARWLPAKQAFVGALIAAGEASGDLAGGFERAADILEARAQLREQLVSALSYPAFVLVSSLAAVAVILLFVVPSLAPLAQAPGAEPGVAMRVLIGASDFLRSNAVSLGVFTAVMTGGLALGVRLGLLTTTTETLLLDGPIRRTFGGLVFGGFAVALGGMLGAGAPMAEALRLAIRSVRSETARGRLEAVAQAVRQGEALSAALERVRAFPQAVVRLAAVGEASGALGPMMLRAGKLEERAALRRLEAAGRMAGPLLIVLLGGLIGLLMAGLLSGVTELGEAALK